MMNQSQRMVICNWIVALVMAGAVIFQGCDNVSVGNAFLEKPPGSGVTEDTVFSTAKKAKQFLNHAYESLPYAALSIAGPYDINMLNDDPLAAITDINQSFLSNGGSQLYYTGSYSANEADIDRFKVKFNYFNSGAWAGIRDSYIFLNNIDQVPDLSSANKERLKAEARMIIALHYTDFFRNYGGMPWVGHAYGPNENFQLPRLTAKATFDSTLDIINKAIPHLPFSLENPEQNAGRFTKAGAMGLKVRLLLFAASPLFNSDQPYMSGEAAREKLVWFGGYDGNLWNRAADAAKELINKIENTEAYHLADTGHPRQDFKHGYYDRDSPELLISTRKRYTASGMPNAYTSGNNKGAVATTDNYVKMFPMAGGTPISQAGSGYDPSHPYKNRDPRLYKTVLVNGASYQNRTAELWIGGRERSSKSFRGTRTGYRLHKYILDVNNAVNQPVQFPYLRLSEIYLSYAEALDQVNNGPTAEACKYVNKVRNRVDLDDLSNCVNLSKEKFRKKIIRERVLELGYENDRWFDLIRWKMKDVFTKTLYGMNICKKGASPQGACKDNGVGYNESNNYIYARYKLADRYWKNNFSPKWYLSAFPLNEINKNYGLIQNPGW